MRHTVAQDIMATRENMGAITLMGHLSLTTIAAITHLGVLIAGLAPPM